MAGAILATLLSPAEVGYRSGVALRNRAFDLGIRGQSRAHIPVISVGNLTVGGTGKTPFAAWVVSRLGGWGARPAVVLRGYGQDEIMVHRELNPDVPVFAATRRIDAIREAVAAGCNVAVLDDGFQHRALARDLDIVLIAADQWPGSTRMLPVGPGREPIGALARAGIAVVTRKAAPYADAERVAEELRGRFGAVPVAICRFGPVGFASLHDPSQMPRPIEWAEGLSVVAATSLADPDALVRQLKALGARVELRAFPDHHRFSRAEVRSLLARAAGRPIVITRKEAVKLRALVAPEHEVVVVEQRMDFELGQAEVELALQRAIRT